MNSVCLYVFWNSHEPEEGVFDFTGQNDLREFVKLCQKNGMNVILRPGPYVCAEWEMGGLPWWLLKDKDIRLREDDPLFMSRVETFEKAVAGEVADLTMPNGGPIMMIQVENEYGSYGKDKGYVGKIRDLLRSLYGEEVTMFQCDWSSNFLDNGLDDLLWTLNFGAGSDPAMEFAPLKAVRPDQPLMCSEYWSGWYDKWGEEHETRTPEAMMSGIEKMLADSISFSLYMTHGGTNWGHWVGANDPGYRPLVASYDYDAPISEAGQLTEKYHLLRTLLQQYSENPLPEIPARYRLMSLQEVSLDSAAPIFDNLPLPLKVSPEDDLSFEALGQGFGSIIYAANIDSIPAGTLLRGDFRDYSQVYVDGVYAGAIDRRKDENELALPTSAGKVTIMILTEAMGRINFGRRIKDFKGLVGDALLVSPNDTTPLPISEVFLLPDNEEYYSSLHYSPIRVGDCHPAGAYKGHFNLPAPTEENGMSNGVDGGYADTFLDVSGLSKGLAFVNGHPFGRYWNIGPQQTLYLPGAWLREGDNEIMIFDIIGPSTLSVKGLSSPINDRLR